MGRDDQRHRAGRWLAEAALIGDAAVAAKYSISLRTLQRWRKRLATGGDKKLTEVVAAKRDLVDADWADEVVGAMHGLIGFIKRSAADGDPTDPNMLHAIAGAMKILAGVSATKKILDERFGSARGTRPTGQDNRPVGPEEPGNVRPIRRTG